MITDSELKISNESYTRKDFYQLYPEILDLVTQITDRWMPSAESNESDPGVVLLKLLAFIADKTNYNIDKNILECFMPSATQEDSMRKLCDMMGYDMHYYRAAETEVSFMWTSIKLASTANQSTGSITLKAFDTVITDDANEVSYVLIDPVELTHRNDVKSGTAIEGTLCEFEINDDNIVKYYNLDDNLRLYFPETHIAENGVWIYNEEDKDSKKNPWQRVTNLNIQTPDTKVWKFGYDSKKKLPYIQFPSDVIELLNNGLHIYYIRTSGESGNIGAKTLTTLANATTVPYTGADGTVEDVDISVDNDNYLTIQNISASVNGGDVESIDEAYNGFKKTVGTFDTLVTCRDYANAIYNLVNENYNPYVSNVIVSDIRDNLNFSKNIVTLDAYGCHNILVPTTHTESDQVVNDIDHFDLYILPFKPITTSYTSKTFQNSFKPNSENYYDIVNALEEHKTISHEYKTLDAISNGVKIYCLKNKYQLEAKITTTYKVNSAEQKQILNNVYTALYKNFNARKVDFGEEIPYDTVLKVIEEADNRIKVVILEDFTIVPYVMLANGNEYKLVATESSDTTEMSVSKYRELVAKNVLAGRLPLFNYDNTVEYKYGEGANSTYNTIVGGKQNYPTTVASGATQPTPSATNSVTYITTDLQIDLAAFEGTYELTANESIQFIAPAYKGIVTYPAYTNYFANVDTTSSSAGTPCALNEVVVKNASGTIINMNQDAFSAVMLKMVEKQHTPMLYLKSTAANFAKQKGYLVDNNFFVYSPTTQFYNSRNYYSEYTIEVREKADSSGYTVTISNVATGTFGEDAEYGFVPANTEYKLDANEYIAIHFKDSDGNSHDILYKGTSSKGEKIEYINEIRQPVTDFSGYIKCNFNLYNSLDWHVMGSGHKYVKTTDYYFGSEAEIPGMFSLGASEEIEPREKVEVTFDGNSGAVLKCYWYTNEPKGTLTFKKITSGSSYYYERILDADEYFFYTNDAETVLVTYGSGTILRLNGANWGANAYIVWKLPEDEEDSLNTDEVASKGISAFSDVDWQLQAINSNKQLTICEASIVTLGEGDNLQGLTLGSGVTKLTGDWTTIPSSAVGNIIYNGSNKLTRGLEWSVRGILNLNMGPSCIQTLKKTNTVTESITTYTSAWYYIDSNEEKHYGNPATDTDHQWGDYTEERVTTYTQEFKDISLKSNYLIQRAGGTLLSAHRYTTDKTETDDLLIVPFDNTSCQRSYHSRSSETYETIEINENYNKLDLSDLAKLYLPVNLKANKFGIITFYYTKGAGDDAVTISLAPKTGTTPTGANIGLYSSRPWLNSTKQTTYTLQEGLNCLYVKNASSVAILPTWSSGSQHKGTVVVTQMSVVDDLYTKSGLNYTLLGLPKDSGAPTSTSPCESFLANYITSETDFFYNAPIANDDLIDVESMDPIDNNYAGWQHVNNVCNKFTIPELDVDSFVRIEIAKPSKK